MINSFINQIIPFNALGILLSFTKPISCSNSFSTVVTGSLADFALVLTFTFAWLENNTEITTTSVHTNYLRSTKDQDMHARVEVHRLGRRFGFLQATSWQGDETKPVAISEIGIRIRRIEEE